MSPIQYTTKVLPDGHIPLPKDYPAKAGEEVDVTLAPPLAEISKEEAIKCTEYLLKNWCGIYRGNGESVAEHHDDYLYGDRSA